MCSYNKINGTYACENDHLLNVHLRKYLGFDGFIMSDWGAAHSLSIAQGLDQEQNFFTHYYTQSVVKKADVRLVNKAVE